MHALRKNHKFLSVSGDVKQICNPLNHLKIPMFSYMKNFHDGTQINISTNPQWIEDYYALQLNESSHFEGDSIQYETGFTYWSDSNAPVILHGQNYFHSFGGVTYCNQLQDGCEFFHFTLATQKQDSALDFYLNNLDLLKQFVYYFQEKSRPLLKECNPYRISRKINSLSPSISTHSPTSFLKAINLDPKVAKLAHFLLQFERLTHREKECLIFLLTASSTAEIAQIMNISIRTVEHHLENIKNKLHCTSKNELLRKLISHYIL